MAIYEVRESRKGGYTVFNTLSREHVAHRNDRDLADAYAAEANRLAVGMGLDA